MEIMTVYLCLSATLNVHPDRSQFFRYETITLNCAVQGNFNGWTVMRNTSTESSVSCEDGWGRPNGSSCIVKGLYSSDSGVYWCESKQGKCSNVLNITVNTGVVILESPALPVTEGDEVTLRCSYKERYAKNSMSDFRAIFYKNKDFIGIMPEGKMILPSVKASDGGFYKCKHPTEGESVESLLTVTVPSEPTPPFFSLPKLLCTALLFIFYIVIMILCICVFRRLTRARAAARKRPSDHLIVEG